jgi:citrate lyase subunit beta/citryl-CoA lyase
MTADGRDWLVGPVLLFCPGDRPDRFAKAAAVADMVILDLEDGVGPADKALARKAIHDSELDPARTIVRVNPCGSNEQEEDREMLERTSYRNVMVPKVESPAGLQSFDDCNVIALCETPFGILNATALASNSIVAGLMWGAEDLTAALGGTSSRLPDGGYTDVVRSARSRVLLAAGAYGKPAIDAVYTHYSDLAGLQHEADDAAASGFAAKACVHPLQATVVRRSFTPSDDSIAWAREVLGLAGESHGAFSHHEQMIDEPLLRQAKAIALRAGLAAASGA